MKKYLPLVSLPALFLAAPFAGADTLYWVDATSYFDAAPLRADRRQIHLEYRKRFFRHGEIPVLRQL